MQRTTAPQRSAHEKTRRPNLTLILALGLAGCGSIGAGPEGPSENGTTTTDDDATANADGAGGNGGGSGDGSGDASGGGSVDDGDTIQVNKPCGELALETQEILTDHCSSCHGPSSPGDGGFNTVLSVPTLVNSGKIVGGNPDDSPLYVRLSTGSMPPATVGDRPSAQEIATVRSWIECGAVDWETGSAGAFAFISVDDRVRTILSDIRSFSSQADRRRLRYIDFTHLANAGFSESQINQYRESVAMILNSVSYGAAVVPPSAVDRDKLLYRIDLRDYGFDEDTWDLIVEDYPYAVVYDQNSQLFPYDEVSAEQLRLETETDIPYIQADWLITHASQPPLYYDLLGFESLDQIANLVGVDIDDNVENLDVARSGFAESGVSVNNRIIERHELPGNQGAFWISYDFADNVANSNIFANPLDFQEDGGEGFFNLPNGLQAYFLINNQGVLLSNGPTNIVTDPNSRDGSVVAGLSCMSNCHFTEGIIPKDDTVRAFQETSAQDRNELAIVRELYLQPSEMRELMDRDRDRYTRAKTSLGVVKSVEKTIQVIVNAHLDRLTLNDAASALGVSSSDLAQALNATPQAFPPEVITLRDRGGSIQRDTFENVFDDLVEALGLGAPLRSSFDSFGSFGSF